MRCRADGHGRSPQRVRYLLAIFSAVAPVLSLFTYIVLGSVHVSLPKNVWTGLVLLFSAGSFLFVAAAHVLPEIRRERATDQDDAFALGRPASRWTLSASQVGRRPEGRPAQHDAKKPTRLRRTHSVPDASCARSRSSWGC